MPLKISRLGSDSRNVKKSEMQVFAKERERSTYAFSACRICSFASSIFDIFLRMITFSSALIQWRRNCTF